MLATILNVFFSSGHDVVNCSGPQLRQEAAMTPQ